MTLKTAVEEEGTDPLAVGMRNPGRTRPVEVHDCHRREFLLGGADNYRRDGIPRRRGWRKEQASNCGGGEEGELGRSRFTSDSSSRGSARASRRRG